MEENRDLEVVETVEPETSELMEYDECSNGLATLIGIGIGVTCTLLAKKGVHAVKKAWSKRKEKKSIVEDEDFDEFEDDEEPEETDYKKTSKKK